MRGRRVALVAHPASVTHDFVHARDVLLEAGAPRSVRSLGPNTDTAAKRKTWWESTVRATGRPARRSTLLYGAGVQLAFAEARMARRGSMRWSSTCKTSASRYYTFVWTAVLVARACSAAGVETIILDRPNPLGRPCTIEASAADFSMRCARSSACETGAHSARAHCRRDRASTRRGSEKLVGRLGGRDARLASRSMLLRRHGAAVGFGRRRTMPTADTVRVYPGGCLLEGTQASEGSWGRRARSKCLAHRGLTVAMPGAGAIERDGGPGLRARSTTFRPTFQKHARVPCGGVQLHVTDVARFQPYRAYLAALSAMRRMEGFQWRTEPYEFVADRPAIDLLTGDPRVRDRDQIRVAHVDGSSASSEKERMSPWRDPRARWLYAE